MKKCLQCHKDLTAPAMKKFCSLTCAGKYNSVRRLKQPRTGTGVPEKTSRCANCGKEFLFHENKSFGKYCKSKCFHDYRFASETKLRIERGECWFSGTLKKYLTKERGYKCEQCGLVDWQDKSISLHVDHIDGNSDNNLPYNIRLLCPNCHSQTETFGGRNKKNSKRTTSTQRYRARRLVTQTNEANGTPERNRTFV